MFFIHITIFIYFLNRGKWILSSKSRSKLLVIRSVKYFYIQFYGCVDLKTNNFVGPLDLQTLAE